MDNVFDNINRAIEEATNNANSSEEAQSVESLAESTSSDIGEAMPSSDVPNDVDEENELENIEIYIKKPNILKSLIKEWKNYYSALLDAIFHLGLAPIASFIKTSINVAVRIFKRNK